MVMRSETISASEFKARCLAIIDDVACGDLEVVITKRGKPLARLAAIAAQPWRELEGSVGYASDEDILAPLDDEWDMDK